MGLGPAACRLDDSRLLPDLGAYDILRRKSVSAAAEVVGAELLLCLEPPDSLVPSRIERRQALADELVPPPDRLPAALGNGGCKGRDGSAPKFMFSVLLSRLQYYFESLYYIILY